jgi:hypothetical protein
MTEARHSVVPTRGQLEMLSVRLMHEYDPRFDAAKLDLSIGRVRSLISRGIGAPWQSHADCRKMRLPWYEARVIPGNLAPMALVRAIDRPPRAERPLNVRYPSADRPLTVRQASAGAHFRIPSAQIGWQLEFITCTVGDTTNSGGHGILDAQNVAERRSQRGSSS